MQASAWKAATIDIDRASEFGSDDVDQYSNLVDLGENYEFLTVEVPTLDAVGAVTVYAQTDSSITTVPKPIVVLKDNAVDHYIPATTTSDDGDIIVTFCIGGCQFIRIKVSADAANDTVFYVRGYNR